MNISEKQRKDFKRLLIRVRKVSTDLDSIQGRTAMLEEWRSTIRGIYAELSGIINFFPDYFNAFLGIPSDLDTKSAFTFPGSVKMIRGLLDTIEDELNQETGQNIEDKEFFIDSGQAFTANRKIVEIINGSSQIIKVVDNFLAPYSIEIFEQGNSQRVLQILSKDLSTEAIKAATIAKQARHLEIRECFNFHDRYLIIDDKEVWACGPSLKHLGVKKPGVLVKLSDQEVVRAIVKKFDEEWVNSKVIL